MMALLREYPPVSGSHGTVDLASSCIPAGEDLFVFDWEDAFIGERGTGLRGNSVFIPLTTDILLSTTSSSSAYLCVRASTVDLPLKSFSFYASLR